MISTRAARIEELFEEMIDQPAGERPRLLELLVERILPFSAKYCFCWKPMRPAGTDAVPGYGHLSRQSALSG